MVAEYNRTRYPEFMGPRGNLLIKSWSSENSNYTNYTKCLKRPDAVSSYFFFLSSFISPAFYHNTRRLKTNCYEDWIIGRRYISMKHVIC